MSAPRPPARTRTVALGFVGVLVALVALALRLPWLDALPGPSGDEGNWLWAAHDLAQGRTHALLPDGRFVPLTYARALALAFRLAGDSIAHARAVNVLFALAAVVVSALALRRAQMPRASLSVAAVLAWHPWSVLWSRTVCVPYSTVLSLTAMGTALAFSCVVATALTSRARLARWVLAWQLLALGLHGSPLALVPLASLVLFLLRDRVARTQLGAARTRYALVAFACVLPHVLYVAGGALSVATRGTTRPRAYLTAFFARLETFARTVLGSIDGEATARHFAGASLGSIGEALAALAALALVGWALAGFASSSRDDEPAPARMLRSLAGASFAAALVGTPLLLAPVRQWNMPAVDAERYGFVFVLPAVFALGALAEHRARARALAAFGLSLALLVSTVRTLRALLGHSGPDRGAWLLLDGGAYRGWRVTRERAPLVTLVRDELTRAVAPRTRVAVLMADYALHPLHYALRDAQIYPVDVTKFTAPERPDEHTFYLVFCPELFARGYEPAGEPQANEALRARMRRVHPSARLRRRIAQPDGSCLLDLYEARPGGDALTSPR